MNNDFQSREMQGSMSPEELLAIKRALKAIKEEKNSGEILEFGIYEGLSLSEMILFLNEHNMENKVHGFDSFCGMPRAQGHWNVGDGCSSVENTTRLITKKVIDVKRMKLHKGIYETLFVKDVRERINCNNAAIIHIDCDLSDSCYHVLNICRSVMKKGTIIIIHDWLYGLREVFYRFISENDIFVKFESFSGTPEVGNQVFLRVEYIGNRLDF